MDRDDENRATVEELNARSAGEAHSDPYDDVDVADLPSWWRRAVETFDSYDLRPYRPPQFQDGTRKHEVVEELESELGVDIRFICFNPQDEDTWDIYVDGNQVGAVDHRRAPEGYSVFGIDSDEFESLIRAETRG